MEQKTSQSNSSQKQKWLSHCRITQNFVFNTNSTAKATAPCRDVALVALNLNINARWGKWGKEKLAGLKVEIERVYFHVYKREEWNL